MSPEGTSFLEFLSPNARSRYETLLRTERGRKKVRLDLAHFEHFDAKTVVEIAPKNQQAEKIAELLTGLGAPERCIVLSEDGALDGREMTLPDALSEIVGMGFGTFLSCLSTKLAYFEGEGPANRFILVRRG